MLKTKLYNQLKICSKIIGQPLEKLYDSAYQNNFLRLHILYILVCIQRTI